MFLVNSRYPLVCATPERLPAQRYPFSRSYGVNLPSSFSTVLSIALVYSTSPPVSVWGTVLRWGYFLERLRSPDNPISLNYCHHPSHPTRPWNINQVPIDYGFRPRLRGRLTLRRLALRRNPWTFGVSVSHTHLATHVSILTSDTSTIPHGTASQAYGTLRYHATQASHPQLRCMALDPVHLRRRLPCLDQ